MHLAARTLRYLGIPLFTDPFGFSQFTARTNAAEAATRLRWRRHEYDDLEAFLHEQHKTSRRTEGTETIQRGDESGR